MRQQLGNAGKQNASLIIRMLLPFVTCYDERGISIPPRSICTHLILTTAAGAVLTDSHLLVDQIAQKTN